MWWHIKILASINKNLQKQTKFQLPWVPETFLARFLVLSSLYSDPREKPLEQIAIALMAPIQSLARLNQSLQILDKTADWLLTTTWETNRRYNWLKRIDQHVKEYFQLCCCHDVSVPARGVVMAASESFERALKESISNVLEDKTRQVKLWAIKWGVSFYSTQLSFYHIQLTNFLFQTITTCFEIICIDELGVQ